VEAPMIKIGSVCTIDSDEVDIINLNPDEIFIITGSQMHDDPDINEMTYWIKTTSDGHITWLYERDIVVLCEP